MTPPEAECTCGWSKKSHGVAELRYHAEPVFAVRLPAGAVCIPSEARYHRTSQANYRSFLGIYEIIRTACNAALTASRPDRV
jgi:hypothetical protein